MALSPDFPHVLLPLVNVSVLVVLRGMREIQRFLISLEDEKCNTLLKDQNELWGEKEGGRGGSNLEVHSHGGVFFGELHFSFLFQCMFLFHSGIFL